jgi:hypothetical protein
MEIKEILLFTSPPSEQNELRKVRGIFFTVFLFLMAPEGLMLYTE